MKGRPYGGPADLIGGYVSIHAPVKGRRCRPGAVPPDSRFNPRPREGATHSLIDVGSAYAGFNPRPREGATLLRRPACLCMESFNPRPREGATSVLPGCAGCLHRFNPRPREGATPCRLWRWSARQVSIHAPVKGRQEIASMLSVPDEVSIRAPVKGRHQKPRRLRHYYQFQSTPP